jgi:hypothetical protein
MLLDTEFYRAQYALSYDLFRRYVSGIAECHRDILPRQRELVPRPRMKQKEKCGVHSTPHNIEVPAKPRFSQLFGRFVDVRRSHL